MLERITLGTVYVKDFLSDRFLGPIKALFTDASHSHGVVVAQQGADAGASPTAVEFGSRVLEFVISPSMLVGLLGAALLIAAAIWGRRYREENT